MLDLAAEVLTGHSAHLKPGCEKLTGVGSVAQQPSVLRAVLGPNCMTRHYWSAAMIDISSSTISPSHAVIFRKWSGPAGL